MGLTQGAVVDLFFACADVFEEHQAELATKICMVSYNDDDDRVWLSTTRKEQS